MKVRRIDLDDEQSGRGSPRDSSAPVTNSLAPYNPDATPAAYDQLSSRRARREVGTKQATAANVQPTHAEPLDYCQCNRGPVIGVVTYTDTRLQFFSLEDWHCRHFGEAAADLRCVDCLADAAMDIANGVVRESVRAAARQRGEEMNALMRRNEIRRQAGLPMEWIDPDPESNAWPVGGGR